MKLWIDAPLPMPLTHPTRGFFSLAMDFTPRDEYQDRRTCAEFHGWGPHPWNMPPHPWMGGLHGSRATGSTSAWAVGLATRRSTKGLRAEP